MELPIPETIESRRTRRIRKSSASGSLTQHGFCLEFGLLTTEDSLRQWRSLAADFSVNIAWISTPRDVLSPRHHGGLGKAKTTKIVRKLAEISGFYRRVRQNSTTYPILGLWGCNNWQTNSNCDVLIYRAVARQLTCSVNDVDDNQSYQSCKGARDRIISLQTILFRSSAS